MTDVTVHYERKYSDGNYGSEGLSMSWSVAYDDADEELAINPAVAEGRCRAIASVLRAAVLSQLAQSEARNVAYAAERELNPPHNNNLQPIAAGGPAESLEDMPF